jgi:hypothetical protein
MDTEAFDAQGYIDEWNSPEFLHGQAVGESVGSYETSSEAIRAYDAGEIDLWIDLMRPKTSEAWDTWEAEHGDSKTFKERWA